ncbi:EAL domain-containing protein [Phreatobacter oligotrophus]|uniref:Cyclic-di-GMP phosphodiesterase TipF (Flagellum assembly factor) n=1 Tax=Phreatobacter oligotrophus TaxID=1122261 RepID=A0A2T4ZGV0_9HYPH|nr:EAL domain-containing protein [Phreatobacter oligotrophus]PTM61138.1 cyclic-di-GMP phosphodiesterase TipF (flagellum assembly factor) [Phreatobacter oligotrophus]
MNRPGSFLVALSMVAIAASVAVLAFTLGGLDAGTAAAAGCALLLALVIGHLGAQLAADRAATDRRLDALTRASGDLARDLGDIAERMDRIEVLAEEKAREASEPLGEEIRELGVLVKQFAETLQVHEAAIIAAGSPQMETYAQPVMTAPPPPPPVQAPVAQPAVAQAAPPPPPVQVLQRQAGALRRGAEARMSSPDLPEALAGIGRADAITILDEAISSKRYELFLQPIVTLPQRKVRFYQASVRLRTADGRVLLPEDYRALAEDAGLMPGLDTEVLGRCVQIVRRLTARNRDVGLVCDLSGSSLTDAAFATDLIASLEASRAIAGSLMLGFSQQTLRDMSSLDADTLRALSDKGFRFAMDGVRDLRIEPRDVAEKGIRLIKVPAPLMIARAADTGASIHVADLAGLFARYGMDLVVEDVESESVVVDLLDYEVKFAQGALFSPPRPVRAEVMAAAEPAGLQPAPAAAAAPRQRTEPRVDPRSPAAAPAAPQTLGAAVLAQGAVTREPRRPGSSGLRALIRDRS